MELRRKNCGFTLIETVIYVSMLAVVLVFTINMLLVIFSTVGDFKATRRLNSSAEAAMERMIRETRSAYSVDDAASVFEAHPGRLYLHKKNPDTGAEETMEFYLSGAALAYKANGGAEQLLSLPEIEVTNLVFRKLTGSTVSQAVKIEMQMRSSAEQYKSGNFYSTIILRGGY
ncbi:MAG: prepilin-type N-terminal cleavage/methylation domain-containing protein [Candidatus Niyogibacteria bacterium]|nr:prepilin-type N-terminal cleavage/methylation domain-containing protein [Candidatus Niyogibacteria bacterium]